MSSFRGLPVVLFTAGLLGSVRPAEAQTVLDSGTWYRFSFAGAGQFASDPLPPFVVPVLAGARFRVVDAFGKGDRFRVYSNGALLGDTTAAVTDSEATTDDPDLAWNDAAYSRGEFYLGLGSYSIAIQALEAPFGGSDAFMRWDIAEGGPDDPLPEPPASMPEPGADLLFLPALGVVAFLKRRR